jgi:DNA-binding NarL/FixJ family response regulator
MKPLRILLAEDHSLVRAGIRRVLEDIAGVEVVGEAADGAEAFELARMARPDIVVLDISMPGIGGLDAAARFRREMPDVRVVILTMHAGEAYVLEALHAGVVGYLLKHAALEELPLAIQAICAGGTFLSPTVSRHVITAFMESANGEQARTRITPRQRQVLRLVAEGRTSREIAERLGLSVRTVETHRAELMARLDCPDIETLKLEAARLGLGREK